MRKRHLHRQLAALLMMVGPPGCQLDDSNEMAETDTSAAAGSNCAEPALVFGPPGDNTDDVRRAAASGRPMLFRRVAAPPFTEPPDPTKQGSASDGIGIVDLDRDGRPDIVAVRNLATPKFTVLWHRNLGCLRFAVETLVPPTSGRLDVPTFVDLDGDDMLDFYAGASSGSPSRLYLARGSRTKFVDVAASMGVQNPGVYNHGHVGVGDLDGDGALDLAVGANQIGNGESGRALRRLYRYVAPAPGKPYEAGRFVDLSTLANPAGADLVPDFMSRRDGSSIVTVAEGSCNRSLDRSGAMLLVRDLDEDGDLDLVEGASNDMYTGKVSRACASGVWRSGVWAWTNQSANGNPAFTLVPEAPNALADWGQMRYVNPLLPGRDGYYEVDPSGPGRAFSPLSLNAADIDNDDDLDVLGLTPTDPSWHVQSDLIAARLWVNNGAGGFSQATNARGLEALNWTYSQLASTWSTTLPANIPELTEACNASDWKPACKAMAPGDYQMMLYGSVWADFNNDGWLDLHVVDRHDAMPDIIRNLVFLNRGNGSFRLLVTEDSGIEGTGIAADARDLDGDGRLELVVLERDNAKQADGYLARDRIYWNTGAFGGTSNHWSIVQLEGYPAAKLIGATVRAYPAGASRLLGRRELFPSSGTYKTSQDLELHFGLGDETAVDLTVELPGAPNGRIRFSRVPIDRRIALDVRNGTVRQLVIGAQ